MPAFVKTARDERLWQEAKQIVKDEYGNLPRGKYWALVNRIFHRMKYRAGGGEYPRRRNPVAKKRRKSTRRRAISKPINWLLWGTVALIVIFLIKRSADAALSAKPPEALPAPPSNDTSLNPAVQPIEGFYADESPYFHLR